MNRRNYDPVVYQEEEQISIRRGVLNYEKGCVDGYDL